MSTEQSLIDRFKQHWLISLVLICVGVAGSTWEVAHELVVAPREFQLSQLKEENAK